MGTIGQNSGIRHEMKSSNKTEGRYLGGKGEKGMGNNSSQEFCFLFYTNRMKEPQLWLFIFLCHYRLQLPSRLCFPGGSNPAGSLGIIQIQLWIWEFPTPHTWVCAPWDDKSPAEHSCTTLAGKGKGKAFAKSNYYNDTKTSLIINDEPLAVLVFKVSYLAQVVFKWFHLVKNFTLQARWCFKLKT